MRPFPRTIRDVSTPNRRNSADTRVGDRILGGSTVTYTAGQPELRQRYRHVRLAAAECRHELRRLQKALEARRREPQHDLSECDNLLGHE